MGCFSGICRECGENVKSNAFSSGDKVRLFLLRGGYVLEKLVGEYNGYGEVFGKKWRRPWEHVCRLMASKNNSDGIAYIHEQCYKYEPTLRSERDPDQGMQSLDDYEEY